MGYKNGQNSGDAMPGRPHIFTECQYPATATEHWSSVKY